MTFVTVATLADQTLVVTPRYSGQSYKFGSDTFISEALIPIRLTGDGTVELGDGWWDDVAIVDGGYDGPYFDGNTAPIFENQHSRTTWDDTPESSTSTMEIYTILKTPGRVGDAYIIDGDLWIFTEYDVWTNFGAFPS